MNCLTFCRKGFPKSVQILQVLSWASSFESQLRRIDQYVIQQRWIWQRNTGFNHVLQAPFVTGTAFTREWTAMHHFLSWFSIRKAALCTVPRTSISGLSQYCSVVNVIHTKSNRWMQLNLEILIESCSLFSYLLPLMLFLKLPDQLVQPCLKVQKIRAWSGLTYSALLTSVLNQCWIWLTTLL